MKRFYDRKSICEIFFVRNISNTPTHVMHGQFIYPKFVKARTGPGRSE